MIIAVLGSTGKTGRLVVEQALAAGHTVRALARNVAGLSSISAQPGQLEVIQGDALNDAAIRTVVQGVGAVINTVGHVKGSPADLQRRATPLVVAAMKAAGVTRLVSLTGQGVEDPSDQPKFINHVIKFALKTIARHVYDDGIANAEIIRTSGLDWVLVRAPRLTTDPAKGSVQVGVVGTTGTMLTRADLAKFMLDQAVSPTVHKSAPAVSN